MDSLIHFSFLFSFCKFSIGYYQPAGPLITSHLVGGPQNLTKSSIPSPLDSDPLQQPQQSTSAGEGMQLLLVSFLFLLSPFNLLMNYQIGFLGVDFSRPSHTFRYPNQSLSQGQQSQQQPTQLQLPPTLSGSYSRPMHQMHCPTYPPSYYAFSQHPQDMCYSPPYQPAYYPPKVYPTSYRRYMPSPTAYYQSQPTDMYEPTLGPPTSAPPPQPQPTQMQSPSGQLVPSTPNPQQHIEHYSPYYTGYNPGGGQCYTRGIQPPYMGKQMYANSIHSHS